MLHVAVDLKVVSGGLHGDIFIKGSNMVLFMRLLLFIGSLDLVLPEGHSFLISDWQSLFLHIEDRSVNEVQVDPTDGGGKEVFIRLLKIDSVI